MEHQGSEGRGRREEVRERSHPRDDSRDKDEPTQPIKIAAREVGKPGDCSVWEPGEESASRRREGAAVPNVDQVRWGQRWTLRFGSQKLSAAWERLYPCSGFKKVEREGGDAENVGDSRRGFSVREIKTGSNSWRA